MSFRKLPITVAVVATSIVGWYVVAGRFDRAAAGFVASDPPSGTQLPQPDPAFQGKIAESFKNSTPSYPKPVTPAACARHSADRCRRRIWTNSRRMG
jgi:hypothetical protein